jgi:hypothetical protein
MGRIDHARAHGIDPNAARRTIHRGAFGQADHPGVRGAIRWSDLPARRPPSSEQLTIAPLPCVRIWRSSMLHAGPDTAQIHGGHLVEALRRLIG